MTGQLNNNNASYGPLDFTLQDLALGELYTIVVIPVIKTFFV